jgi:hypothetical protein
MTSGHLDRDDTCPHWCAADHSAIDDEAGHVHIGAEEHLTGHVAVRLVASRHQETGVLDGPYLLVDSPLLGLDAHELDLGRARHIGEALIALAADATSNDALLPLKNQG